MTTSEARRGVTALGDFLSQELRHARMERGWTASHLAGRASSESVTCSRMFVVNLETRPLPASLRRFLRLCDALLIRHDHLEQLTRRSLTIGDPQSLWASELKQRRTRLLGATRRDLSALSYSGQSLATEDYVRRVERQGPGLTVLRALSIAQQLGIPLSALRDSSALEERLSKEPDAELGSDVRRLAECGKLTSAWSLAWSQVCSTSADPSHAHPRALLIASIIAMYLSADGFATLLADAARRLKPHDESLLRRILIQRARCASVSRDFQTTLTLIDEHRALFRESSSLEEMWIRQHHAQSLAGFGRFKEALELLPESSALDSPESGTEDAVLGSLVIRAEILAELGRNEEAAHLIFRIDCFAAQFAQSGSVVSVARSDWLQRLAPDMQRMGRVQFARAMKKMAKKDARGEFTEATALRHVLMDYLVRESDGPPLSDAERRSVARRALDQSLDLWTYGLVMDLCRPLLRSPGVATTVPKQEGATVVPQSGRAPGSQN